MKSFKNFAILTIAILFSSSKAYSQINQWNVYSSFSTVNDIAYTLTSTFVATTGGVFIVNDGIIVERLTTVDGLHRLDPMSILYDQESSSVLLGYADGVIDLIDIDTFDINRISDINRSNEFTSKQIHAFDQSENQIFVATDFGVVVIDNTDLLVLNNFLKIGDFERGIPVYDVEVKGDSILVGTSQGIGIASLEDNLVNPNAWQNFVLNVDGNTRVDNIESNASITISISDNKLFVYDGGVWNTLEVSGINNPIDLYATENIMAVLDQNSVVVINEEGLNSEVYTHSDLSLRSITLTEDHALIGTLADGYLSLNLNNGSITNFLPDGPYLNFFSELDFNTGALLATATDEFPQSDPFNPIRGYYVYEDQQWANYNRNTNPELADFSFSSAYSALNGTQYYAVGSWGGGIVLQEKENDQIRVFNKSNSGFSGISANRNFVVISGIDEDTESNIWAISYLSDFPLNVYEASSNTWSHFESVPINSDELYFRIFIDSNDHLWIPLIDVSNNGQGLLIIDTGSDIQSSSDDTYRKLSTGENNGNLPDDNVTAVVEDKEGEVWIGTPRGIARFIFPDFIVSSNNPSEFRAQWLINSDTAAASRFLLRDVNVASIAVNNANQKWIGSRNQGVWLLNEDGSEILRRFTRNNSPLLSDNIQDITIDERTGEVFFSTDLGLISFTDVAKEPTSKMEELKVFPNPYVYDKHNQITIENLSDQTTIRIVGADGSVFNEFESRGGRTVWDGRTADGKELSSGVYFVIALDASNNEKGIGKVVIIR
jgi:hypothetical protein